MQKFILVCCALMCPGLVLASCPAADTLITTYGISFSGFKKSIAKLPTEPDFGGRREDLARIVLPSEGNVKDGFQHSAVINKVTKQAWLLRTGGFVSVYEWYGPIRVDNVDLEGCIVNAAFLNRK